VHELALMESVIEAVCERVPDGKVVRLRLEIGQLAAVEPDALRFCFEVCSAGSVLDGAALEIIEIAASGWCRACQREVEAEGPVPLCPCGSADVEWQAGQELRIKDVEVI
jgi:hydrogenase nickel incorporation protein HypA/HybF